MTDAQEREAIRLLKIAARAAHKLAVNRHVYRYKWMNELSFEAVVLEEEAEAFKKLVAEVAA